MPNSPVSREQALAALDRLKGAEPAQHLQTLRRFIEQQAAVPQWTKRERTLASFALYLFADGARGKANAAGQDKSNPVAGNAMKSFLRDAEDAETLRAKINASAAPQPEEAKDTK